MKIETVIEKFGLREIDLLEENTSRLGGQIFRFKDSSGVEVFLKSGQGFAAESLARENKVLSWFSNKQLNVPKVLNYFEDEKNSTVYLLLSAIEGCRSYKAENLSKEEILHQAASALKELHAISLHGAENLRTLDDDLSHIQKCLECDLINKEDFQEANGGKKPEEVYSYLLKMKTNFSNNTLVHGDYCLPNILISDRGYGLIDLGDCGPGDPYKDFSAMEVSIKRNFGKEWIETFYKHYGGIEKIDNTKIEYYQLIDQFDYHLDFEKYNKLFGIEKEL